MPLGMKKAPDGGKGVEVPQRLSPAGGNEQAATNEMGVLVRRARPFHDKGHLFSSFFLFEEGSKDSARYQRRTRCVHEKNNPVDSE